MVERCTDTDARAGLDPDGCRKATFTQRDGVKVAFLQCGGSYATPLSDVCGPAACGSSILYFAAASTTAARST